MSHRRTLAVAFAVALAGVFLSARIARSRAAQAAASRAAGPSVLLVTASGGFVHEVVAPPAGDSLVFTTMKHLVEKELGGTLARTADFATVDAANLDPAKAQVVVFYTTGELPDPLPALLQAYVQGGGNLLGIHCATDTGKASPAYANLIGGTFDGHPWGADSAVVLRRTDGEHAAVRALGGRLALQEEIYLHKNFDPAAVRVLEVLDMEETRYKRPRYVPVVWCKQVGQGRVLYTALGHRPDVWRADWYRRHLADSMRWLLGEVPGSAEPNPRESGREATLAKAAFQRWAEEQAGREPGQSPREPRRVPETPNPAGKPDGGSGRRN